MEKQKVGRLHYKLMSIINPDAIKDVEVMTWQEEEEIQNKHLAESLSEFKDAKTGELLFHELIKH